GVETAKPRARMSRTVSKYFSMNSERPGNRQTVPLRPGGGAQRAKRNDTPSGVLRVPVTTASGTGLAGMEKRGMREGSCTPYSRAPGSLKPTHRPQSGPPGAPPAPPQLPPNSQI